MMKKELYFYIFLLLLIVLFVPYILNGEHNYLGPFPDILDAQVTYYKVLANNSEYLFSSNSELIPQFLSLPRVSLGSELYLYVFLTAILGSYNAIVFSLFVSHLIAYIGMYLLLYKKIFQASNPLLIALISFSFSILDFWPYGGISISGIPLLLYVFLELLNGKTKWWWWISFMIYPFYSNFFVYGFFFYILIGVLFIIDYIKSRKIKWRVVLLFSILTVLIVVQDYRYFLEIIYPTFESQRTEYNESVSLLASIVISGKTFLFGHLHSYSHQTLIVAFTFLYLLYSIKRKLEYKKIIYIISATVFVIAIIKGFWIYELSVKFIKESLPFLVSFRFERFFVLYPVLWYVLLALICFSILKSSLNNKKIIVTSFLIINVCFLLFKSYTLQNFKAYFSNNKEKLLMYDDYFAENIYNQIKKEISENTRDYKVASFGIHPNIAIHNGFNTIDGYVIYYPLSYKNQFAKIIKHELEINPVIKNYYSNWGTKLYLFQTEERLGMINDRVVTRLIIPKEKSKTLERLIPFKADINQMKLMSVKYIFSATELEPNSQLKFIKKYEAPLYYVYLYEIVYEL